MHFRDVGYSCREGGIYIQEGASLGLCYFLPQVWVMLLFKGSVKCTFVLCIFLFVLYMIIEKKVLELFLKRKLRHNHRCSCKGSFRVWLKLTKVRTASADWLHFALYSSCGALLLRHMQQPVACWEDPCKSFREVKSGLKGSPKSESEYLGKSKSDASCCYSIVVCVRVCVRARACMYMFPC